MTTLATAVPPVKKMWSHCWSKSAVVSGLAVEVLRQELRDRVGGGRGHLRRLDDGGVPAGNRGDKWRQGEHQRVVPRPDDEAHSERVKLHLDTGGTQHGRRADRDRLHPLPQVRQRVVGLGGEELYVGQIGVGAVAAEVSPQRRVEVLGAVGHHRPQVGQLTLAPVCGTGRTSPEVVAVSGE